MALAKWSYNTSLHSSMGVTPYEFTYGKPPLSIPHYILGTSTNEVVFSLLSTREAIHSSLKSCLLKAQAAIKKHVDAKRRDEEYEDGKWVYIKLCPYC